MKLCIRKSDSAIFRPSYPTDEEVAAGATATFACLFDPEIPGYFFRRVVRRARPKRRWWFWQSLVFAWVDTGETWEPTDDDFMAVTVHLDGTLRRTRYGKLLGGLGIEPGASYAAKIEDVYEVREKETP
jgi:hypothetical protein